MGKLAEVGKIDLAQDWLEARPILARFFEQLVGTVNGNLDLTENIRAKAVEFTFNAANAERPINHGLGRTPVGYILIKASAACSLYDGTTESTSKVAYLKCSAATTVTILFF